MLIGRGMLHILFISYTYGGYITPFPGLLRSNKTNSICETHFRTYSLRSIQAEGPYTGVGGVSNRVEERPLSFRMTRPGKYFKKDICSSKLPKLTRKGLREVHTGSGQKTSLKKELSKKKLSINGKQRISYSYYDDNAITDIEDFEPKKWPFHG
ncbi:unnamed protein product, partial [Iphiclides podalirius]